jgi:hypothetical protein
VLGLALASAAALLIAFNHTHVTEMTVFAATLAIQSLPFLAAGFMVMIERSQGRMALFGRRQETSVPVPVAAVRPDAS